MNEEDVKATIVELMAGLLFPSAFARSVEGFP